MTTPTLSDKLGDFFSVQLGPKLPVPVVNAVPGQTVTLANQDLVNNVTISRNNNVAGGAVIPPLGSVTVAMDKTIWGTAPAGTLPLLVFPGGGNWAPSPAQVAAQINALGLAKDTTLQGTTSAVNAPAFGPAKDTTVNLVNTTLGAPAQDSIRTAIPNNIAITGVPALNLKSATQAANAQSIAAGATFTPAAITGINQPAYNLHLTATAGASSTKPWYTVTVKWIDTASGFIVQFDQFTAFMSSVSNALSTVIYGPADADQMQIAITNNDTVAMTLNTAYVIISSRTNYTADSFYQYFTSAAMPAVPTFQIAASAPVPAQKIIFSLSRTVGVGVTTTPDYALPGYAGPVAIGFRGVSSNQWHMQITEQFTGTIMYSFDFSAGNTLNALWQLPRAPCTLSVTNNGTVLGTINVEIVGQ